MSRNTHAGLSADPLQAPRAVALARADRHISSDALFDGLRSIAPRLGLVFLVAGTLQMVLHWAGH